MSKDYDAVALARREPTISDADRAAIAEAARAELRDRFAMAALTGLLADHTMQDYSVMGFAYLSYEYADAMLKARDND